MWWRLKEIGSRGRRRNGKYEVQTGGGGAGQGGHPARDEQSDVVGRKREVVNNTKERGVTVVVVRICRSDSRANSP